MILPDPFWIAFGKSIRLVAWCDKALRRKALTWRRKLRRFVKG